MPVCGQVWRNVNPLNTFPRRYGKLGIMIQYQPRFTVVLLSSGLDYRTNQRFFAWPCQGWHRRHETSSYSHLSRGCSHVVCLANLYTESLNQHFIGSVTLPQCLGGTIYIWMKVRLSVSIINRVWISLIGFATLVCEISYECDKLTDHFT